MKGLGLSYRGYERPGPVLQRVCTAAGRGGGRTSRLGVDGALDVVGSQDGLLDLTALHEVEGHHEGLQGILPFGQEDHLRRGAHQLIYGGWKCSGII